MLNFRFLEKIAIMKILIVEDENHILDSIVVFLKQQDYLCEVATNYFEAEDKIICFEYDLVVLDITLPDGNGLNLIEKIKIKSAQTGILILSARNSLDDRINGLDKGADDYLPKPFHLTELNARINAIIRRRAYDGKKIISFNEIQINPLLKQVKVNETELDLTKKEYQLIFYLMINKNRIITKGAIAEHLWGDYIDLADNFDFIYTHVKNLRKKIAKAGGKDCIKTIYGIGYQIKAQ